jgi:hypothetical protein
MTFHSLYRLDQVTRPCHDSRVLTSLRCITPRLPRRGADQALCFSLQRVPREALVKVIVRKEERKKRKRKFQLDSNGELYESWNQNNIYHVYTLLVRDIQIQNARHINSHRSEVVK